MYQNKFSIVECIVVLPFSGKQIKLFIKIVNRQYKFNIEYYLTI